MVKWIRKANWLTKLIFKANCWLKWIDKQISSTTGKSKSRKLAWTHWFIKCSIISLICLRKAFKIKSWNRKSSGLVEWITTLDEYLVRTIQKSGCIFKIIKIVVLRSNSWATGDKGYFIIRNRWEKGKTYRLITKQPSTKRGWKVNFCTKKTIAPLIARYITIIKWVFALN